MAKSDTIAKLLAHRIQLGDYTQREIPTEVALAVEVGASRPTARKAIQKLIDQGLVMRRPNGRIQMSESHRNRRLQVCLLGPAFVGGHAAKARVTADHLSDRFNATIRSVEFIHWEDPNITESLANFDGVFLMSSSEPIPPGFPAKLRDAKAAVVCLLGDLSMHGIPSIDLTPVRAFQKILDHLYALGHRKIDCFNTQPADFQIHRRFEQWRLWREAKNVAGDLLSRPVDNYQDPTRGAYLYARELIAAGQWKSTAVWCATTAAAIGVNRALFEAHLRPGADVALAGADDESDSAWVSTPSLTVVQPPDLSPYLAMALEWMAGRGERPWLGPLLATPDDIPLFVGESTAGCGQ